MVVVP